MNIYLYIYIYTLQMHVNKLKSMYCIKSKCVTKHMVANSGSMCC